MSQLCYSNEPFYPRPYGPLNHSLVLLFLLAFSIISLCLMYVCRYVYMLCVYIYIYILLNVYTISSRSTDWTAFYLAERTERLACV